MNRRIVLLIVLLVLGGFAWWLSQGGPASTLDKPMSDFAVQDTGRVTRVFIVDKKGASVDLQRTDKGWMLNGKFDALQPQVDQLLRTFRRVEVRTPVPKSAEPFTLRVMAAASTSWQRSGPRRGSPVTARCAWQPIARPSQWRRRRGSRWRTTSPLRSLRRAAVARSRSSGCVRSAKRSVRSSLAV